MPSIEELHEYIDHSMTNHAPKDGDVIARFEAVRHFAKVFAHSMGDLCPDNLWRDLAIQKVEEALMWATKSIACDQFNLPDLPMPEVADSVSFEDGEGDQDDVGPFEDAKDLEEFAAEALAPREQEHSVNLTERLGDDSAEAPIHAVDLGEEAAVDRERLILLDKGILGEEDDRG